MSFLSDSKNHAAVQTSPRPSLNGQESMCMAQAQKIVAKTDDLAVLPHVVFKVLEISGSTDSAASELERVITVDPGFSAKLLTYANSSHFALSRKITSIREALLYLGFKSVREMAMTVGVFDMFVGKTDKESLRRRAWWRHSVDTAVCCKVIAENTGKIDPAEAYTCGLLHYIGKSLLDRFGGCDFEMVEKLMEAGTPECDAEKRVYGCSHEDIAAAAGKKWGLPGSVCASFHYSSPPEHDIEFAKYSACVAVATTIASLAVNAAGQGEKLPRWALDELGVAPDEAQGLYEKGLSKIAASAQG